LRLFGERSTFDGTTHAVAPNGGNCIKVA